MNALMGDAEDVTGDALAVWSDKLAMAQDREASELGKVLREFVMTAAATRSASPSNPRLQPRSHAG
jgi:hypothetical protein